MQQDNESPPTQEVYLVRQPIPREEIDLVELWNVLLRRRVLVASVFTATLLLGIIIATTFPLQFTYKATIRVGKIAPESASEKIYRLIEAPSSVVARMREVYIPQAIARFTQANPSLDGRLAIVARWPPKSDILVLEATGPKSLEAAYLEMIDEVSQSVTNDHRRITKAMYASIKAKREELSQAIASYSDQTRLLQAKSDRLEQLETIDRASITELREQLTKLLLHSRRTKSDEEGELARIAALLLDSEARRYRDDLRMLETRVAIEVPNEKDELNRELKQILHQIKVNQTALKRLEARSRTMLDTRALTPPQRSSQPVSIDPFLIVAVFFALGLVLATVVTFIVEALYKRRQQSVFGGDAR